MRKRRRRSMWLQRFFLSLAVFMLGVIIALFGYQLYDHYKTEEFNKKIAQTTPEPTPEETPEETPEPTPEPTLDPEQDERFFDTDSILVIANKKHALPEGYEPKDLIELNVPLVHSYENQLREEAGNALMEMFAQAKSDGIDLLLGSAYRSYDYQYELYHTYLSRNTKEYVDSVSSRPGYSDHQTGLAVDISDADMSDYLEQSFENTAEGQWLFAHAHEYGFILRYPKGKEDITGYSYEPWHYRYVGREYAQKIYEAGDNMTFEEYFGLSGGNYRDYEE